MQYDNDRKAHGGQGENQYTVQMDKTYPSAKPQSTVQKLAKEHNIPEGTMKKNIELGHGINK
ncbi:MAG: hypothetical protein LUD14_01450 [Clostridiales bacterium]|nr:hypothetical protein [Clostridiales bacterium]